MRWTLAIGLAVGLSCTSASAAAADDGRTMVSDPVVVQALEAMGLKPADWPRIELAAAGQFQDGAKQLDRFAAFRMRGDGVIYVNSRHPFYREAKAGGSDVYPILRLASVLCHEMQHARPQHGEADALAAQARFLQRAMIRIPPQRRSNAMAYLQQIERTIPAAREWDRTGQYPVSPK
jgi:hypothetical protein